MNPPFRSCYRSSTFAVAAIAGIILGACAGPKNARLPPTPNFSPACRLGSPYSDPLKSMSIVGRSGAFGALRWKDPDWSVHTGVDLNAPYNKETKIGTPVFAIAKGTIVTVSVHMDYGLTIVLKSHGVESLYAHLSEALVHYGDNINQGQQIAVSGISGNAGRSNEPPHLHFELSNGMPLLYPNDEDGKVIHENAINPCSGRGSTASATISIIGNVKVAKVTLDNAPLPRIDDNDFYAKDIAIGVPNSLIPNNLSHFLKVETSAVCSGTYSVLIKPSKQGGAVYQFNGINDPLIADGFKNGTAASDALIIYENPGIHESDLRLPEPTPAPACSTMPSPS